MLSDPVLKDTSKLAIAAEELIKVACSHAESTSLTISKETLDCVKKLTIDSSSIEKSVESLESSIDSMNNTLNSSILSLKEEVAKLNDFNARQSENQKLEWAISNAAINCFKFHDAAK